MRAAISYGLAALAFVSAAALHAQPALTPQPYVTGLFLPVEMAFPNDGSGRMFVAELEGRVRVVRDGQLLAAPFLDLTPANGGPVKSGGEQGLLGLAFHPAYALNGRFYVYYTRALAGNASSFKAVSMASRTARTGVCVMRATKFGASNAPEPTCTPVSSTRFAAAASMPSTTLRITARSSTACTASGPDSTEASKCSASPMTELRSCPTHELTFDTLAGTPSNNQEIEPYLSRSS